MYVIPDRGDYKSKLNDILKDESKFEGVNVDPNPKLKCRLNNIIETNNEVSNYM